MKLHPLIRKLQQAQNNVDYCIQMDINWSGSLPSGSLENAEKVYADILNEINNALYALENK